MSLPLIVSCPSVRVSVVVTAAAVALQATDAVVAVVAVTTPGETQIDEGLVGSACVLWWW